MELKTATDWYTIQDELLKYCERQSDGKSYHLMTSETARIINNMADMVTEISKAELRARRGKGNREVNELIEKFNSHLAQMEQLLLIHMMETI